MLHPVIGYLGRAALGLGLAFVLAIMGEAFSFMTVVFFGLSSWTAWFTLSVAGAGLGAGLGGWLAWLWQKGAGAAFTALLLLLALAAGIIGAWGGYYYGASQVPECCASPDMGPVSYTVLGAMVGSNLAVLLTAALRLLLRASSGRADSVSPLLRPYDG